MTNDELDYFLANNKVCSRCDEIKPLTEYNKSSDRLRAECKDCSAILRKEKYDADPESHKLRTKNFREANPEKVKASTQAWRDKNPDRVKEYMDEWHENNRPRRKLHYKENREEILAQSKAYNDANKEKTKQRYEENKEFKVAQSVAWAKANRDRATASGARHRASRKQATPAWLNRAHFVEIEGYYQWCSIFPGHHVDHTIPLQANEARGLHVPWNLGILTQKENNAKKNKMPDPTTIAPYIERPTLVIDADGFASIKFEE